ncbi:hypothetical protein LY474_26855 [Myxococcus stipitatus]|uniref:hypothetical protein n=1 Tax=Myxococcus stipitatus TaxID=83455 RepID=UPI001F1BC5DA|nr:hypothetical protein [Myxococcus stipitatus]MCE9671430.1 hypothetical protein [Myxococcus stipitatus]
MRRWSLALILSVSTPALGQDPAAPPAEAAPTPPPAAETPKAETPKAEAPQAEAPKAEQPKAEQPKAPQPKAVAAPTPPVEQAPRPAPTPPPSKPATASTTPPPPAVPSNKAPAAPVAATPPVAAPTPATPASAADLAKEDIRISARLLFQLLLSGDVRNVANELFYPFQLEDKRYATPEELVATWVKQLRMKRTDLVSLYDVEVLTLEEMEKKYGKAPARLALDLRGQKDLWVAVGNLSGHAGVFVYRPYGGEYRAFAYTD